MVICQVCHQLSPNNWIDNGNDITTQGYCIYCGVGNGGSKQFVTVYPLTIDIKKYKISSYNVSKCMFSEPEIKYQFVESYQIILKDRNGKRFTSNPFLVTHNEGKKMFRDPGVNLTNYE